MKRRTAAARLVLVLKGVGRERDGAAAVAAALFLGLLVAEVLAAHLGGRRGEAITTRRTDVIPMPVRRRPDAIREGSSGPFVIGGIGARSASSGPFVVGIGARRV